MKKAKFIYSFLYRHKNDKVGNTVKLKDVVTELEENLPNKIVIFFSFSPRTEMTEENLKWLENVFRRTVGDNGEIRLQDFKNIVHSKNVSITIFSREIIFIHCSTTSTFLLETMSRFFFLASKFFRQIYFSIFCSNQVIFGFSVRITAAAALKVFYWILVN